MNFVLNNAKLTNLTSNPASIWVRIFLSIYEVSEISFLGKKEWRENHWIYLVKQILSSETIRSRSFFFSLKIILIKPVCFVHPKEKDSKTWLCLTESIKHCHHTLTSCIFPLGPKGDGLRREWVNWSYFFTKQFHSSWRDSVIQKAQRKKKQTVVHRLNSLDCVNTAALLLRTRFPLLQNHRRYPRLL